VAILRDVPPGERSRPWNFEFDTYLEAASHPYTAADACAFVLIENAGNGPMTMLVQEVAQDTYGVVPLAGTVTISTVFETDDPVNGTPVTIPVSTGVLIGGEDALRDAAVKYQQPAAIPGAWEYEDGVYRMIGRGQIRMAVTILSKSSPTLYFFLDVERLEDGDWTPLTPYFLAVDNEPAGRIVTRTAHFEQEIAAGDRLRLVLRHDLNNERTISVYRYAFAINYVARQ
jgi:hypothetical protein